MRSKFIIPFALALLLFPGLVPAAQGDVNSLIEKLNTHHSVKGRSLTCHAKGFGPGPPTFPLTLNIPVYTTASLEILLFRGIP